MNIEDPMPKEHPGWFGVFTRAHYPGALENGSRIKKVWEEPGDGTALGTEGTVLGSLGFPDIGVGYFVEWDNRPRVAVFVISKKIGAV